MNEFAELRLGFPTIKARLGVFAKLNLFCVGEESASIQGGQFFVTGMITHPCLLLSSSPAFARQMHVVFAVPGSSGAAHSKPTPPFSRRFPSLITHYNWPIRSPVFALR